jgi:hypothetical protein
MFLMVITVVWAATPARSADPVVDNVTVAPRTDGSGLVDITYDVTDSDGDDLAIAVTISNDAGQTWNVPAMVLSGDHGYGVQPGPGKAIVWNAGSDLGEFVTDQLSVRVLASDVGVLATTHSPGNYWIMDWTEVDWSDDAVVERIAKGDVAVISLYDLWDEPMNESLDVVGRLKELNPDIVVLGYYLNKTNKTFWAENDLGTFTRDLYDSTLPFWSYTTTGDTLMNWSNQVVLNVLDPACRDSIVTHLANYQATTANPLDGVMWDYFDNWIWIAPNVAEFVSGEPDLDGNGISMYDDAAEQVAYRAACDSLVLRTDEILGSDFIQVFNGRRAHTDSAFASLGDGMYYELFPTQIFPDPDMAHAMDPDYEFSLFRTTQWHRTSNGGPYTVLGLIKISRYYDHNGELQDISYGDVFRVTGLLTDTYSTWIPGNHRYNWPEVEFNLGPPTGPTVIDGDDYSRDFMFGRVEMTMESGSYPNPFRFSISIGDSVVHALDIPYHHP